MTEVHPFGNFIPKNSNYLVLGSFTTKPYKGYDFFYSNGRNQFWPIIEEVYKVRLETTNKKKILFSKLHIAIADIIYSCERIKNSNLDVNLKDIILNNTIERILSENNINKIFFTSRFVEKLYRKNFKELIRNYSKINLITLPSPSPRYALLTKKQKVDKYKELLPKY